MLKVRTDYITSSASFVSLAISYLSSSRISLNVCTNNFCTLLFKVKIDHTQQEKYFHIVRDL